MQAAVHCIGDRAMDMVIEAIAKSPYRKDNAKGRHGIVHCQITNPRILRAMKENDILAYIQPVFVDLDMNTVEPAIGTHRMEGIYAWKTMLDLGIHASGGSDAPVVSFDAMENIYFAVTRKNINGEPKEGWIPSERLTVDEAVKLLQNMLLMRRTQRMRTVRSRLERTRILLCLRKTSMRSTRMRSRPRRWI